MAKVKVRYVGPRGYRADNVCGTLTIWTADKPVAAVDEEVAARLCAYPTVWQMADAPVMERPTEPKPDPTEEDPETEAEKLAALGEDMVGDDDEGDNPVDPASGDPVTAEEIGPILSSLDKDTDFSSTGKPLVDSIRAKFPDRSVTAKEVKAAWEAFSNPV